MVMDGHRTAGHERDAPAATEKGAPDNVGQRDELSARLAAVTKMLADVASVEPVVVTIGRALLFLTKAEHAAIFLRSPNGLVTCPWYHNLSDVYIQDIVTPKDANPWIHILRHPELSCMDLPKTKRETSSTPWLLPDALALSSDHVHLVDRITREGLRSMCAWPLTQAGRVTGAFVYCYDSPHVYSQDEQEVMSAFASQAAAALRDLGAPLSQAQIAMNARDTTRTPTDSRAFGLKSGDSAPKQIIDATKPPLADTRRATEDEQARGEIEAARAQLSEAQRRLEAEQARLSADRTSLETDSHRFAQARAAFAAETKRLAEARSALALEADQLAEARQSLEAERARLAETRARLAVAEAQMVQVDAAAAEAKQAQPTARPSDYDARAPRQPQERAASAAEWAQITETLETKTVRLAREQEELEVGRSQLAEAQARSKAAEVARGRDKEALAVEEASVGATRQELAMTQAAPRTGTHEAGKLHEYMWNAVAKVGAEPGERANAARPSRWRQATLVASAVIAAAAAAVLEIGPELHEPAIRTMEHKPAAQVSATAVQKRPVPTPHQTNAARVVPSVAKAGVPPTTSRALGPRKSAYVVVVGTFESTNTAEEVKRLVQSKGYVVHVVLQGRVSKVMTTSMRTRTQAEGVARGLEAVGLQPQLMVW